MAIVAPTEIVPGRWSRPDFEGETSSSPILTPSSVRSSSIPRTGALRTSSLFPRRPRPRPHPWPVRHVFPAASTGTHSTPELGPGTRCGPSQKLERYQRDASTGRRPHRVVSCGCGTQRGHQTHPGGRPFSQRISTESRCRAPQGPTSGHPRPNVPSPSQPQAQRARIVGGQWRCHGCRNGRWYQRKQLRGGEHRTKSS